MSDLSGLNISGADFYTEALNSVLGTDSSSNKGAGSNPSFEAIFNSAMGMIKEVDSLAGKAEKAAIDFTLGKTESTHELTIAQNKAYLSLQYTVAVKNALLDAYKEIMNIQI